VCPQASSNLSVAGGEEHKSVLKVMLAKSEKSMIKNKNQEQRLRVVGDSSL
jgi:hypothetical protein